MDQDDITPYFDLDRNNCFYIDLGYCRGRTDVFIIYNGKYLTIENFLKRAPMKLRNIILYNLDKLNERAIREIRGY